MAAQILRGSGRNNFMGTHVTSWCSIILHVVLASLSNVDVGIELIPHTSCSSLMNAYHFE